MLNRITILIGLLSSLITVGLTVYNAQLNQTIQRAELRLKETETELKKKAQDLDILKENTSRYQFVNQLLPDLLKNDKSKVTLTTNLITLVLTDDEARKLFSGLQASTERDVQEAGKVGTASLASQRDTLRSAQDHEAAAFEALIKGDYAIALKEFRETESVYPTFHQAYEISRLLGTNINSMGDANTRRRVLRTIANQLNYGAPPEYVRKLDEMSR